MSLIACWCGNVYQDDHLIAICPACMAIATLPRLSSQDEREMNDSLDRLVAHQYPAMDGLASQLGVGQRGP